MSRLHIADSGLFVAMRQPSNSRYQAVRRFARRSDITFVLPERVYEELTIGNSSRGVRAPLRFTDVGVEERFEWDASEKLANNKNIQTLLEAPKSRERLEMTLDELERDYDYIIVDTPLSLNVLTDNALVATGNVVIPVIPEKLNANSLRIFAKQLSSLEPAYGDINRLAIVCNRAEQNSEHRDTIEEIKSAYSLLMFEIPKRTDLSQSIGEGVSVFGFGKENQRVEDARDLFNETFEKAAPEEVEA